MRQVLKKCHGEISAKTTAQQLAYEVRIKKDLHGRKSDTGIMKDFDRFFHELLIDFWNPIYFRWVLC